MAPEVTPIEVIKGLAIFGFIVWLINLKKK